MAVAVASKAATGTWSRLFPNELGTEVYSLVFVKKLFAVAVSYVLYMRRLFPDNAFFDKQLEGVRLKILREDNKFPGSSKVVYWLRGCFDAIDRQYLKAASITLYSQSSEDDSKSDYIGCRIVESYSFKLSYTSSSVSLRVSSVKDDQSTSNVCEISSESHADVKQATMNLLTTIKTAGEKLRKLPENLYMTMRLQYFEEATPLDYIPPGFKPADDILFQFDGNPINLRIGNVHTNFHSMKMNIQTNAEFLPGARSAPQTTEGVMELSQQSVDLDEETSFTQTHSKVIPEDELTSSLKHQTLQSDGDQSESYDVRCPCGVHKDDGVMILCDGCGMWQHAVCFRILEENDVPTSHICELCSETKPELLTKGGITDTTLQGISEDGRRSQCLLRRAILLCASMDSISPSIISKNLEVEYSTARAIFNRLVKEGALKDAGSKRGEKLVQREYLESDIFVRVFQVDSKRNNSNASPSQKTSLSSSSIHRDASIRHTPRRALEESSQVPMEEEASCEASQDSVFSPVPVKRRKRSGIANTPIPIARK